MAISEMAISSYPLHFANVATRELAMAKSVGNGQAKADVKPWI